MRTEKQKASDLANLKKVKRPGGAGNAAWLAAGEKNRADARREKRVGFKKGHMPAVPWTSETASKARKAQLVSEENQANELRAEGYEVYSPTVVCDRVAVKDDKVFFVDFKKPGQKLRPGQQRIHDLVPDRYLIKYEK